MKITLPVYFVACLLTVQTHSQTKLAEKIDSLARHQQWTSEIPGYAVGVIANNKVIYKKALGVQSMKSRQPLSAVSDFHMASVSKPIAATAILQLAEKGKLNLNYLLADCLPGFTMKDERYRHITLYHMLTHSSGIPDVRDYEWNAPQNDDSAIKRYAGSFSQASLDFAPGERFSYSNAAYNLLAAVVEKISGLSFEEYVQRNIFEPAEMINTGFLFGSIPAVRRTAPHIIGSQIKQVISEVYPYNRIHAASSTLHSNVEDMLKWARVFLNKGRVNKKTVITDSTWRAMTQPRVKVSDASRVCLSWFVTSVEGKKVYFHSGGDLGYRSFVGFEPESGAAVVLMGNNELFDGGRFGLAIFKAILSNTGLQLHPKNISFKLKEHILTEGIKKTKQVYYEEKNHHLSDYDFSASAVATLSEWLFDAGHKQEAIDVLIFCTELEPHASRWYQYIGDIYADMQNKQQAAEWYRKALQVDPSNEKIKEKLK